MNLTRHTDYSLRVLMYVALKQDQLSTIGEIADSYSISKNHLMKVVNELTQKGYLKAVRGKFGGVLLNLPPEQINIGKLVRDVEQNQAIVECMGDNKACVIVPTCTLKAVFQDALQAFFAILDQYTLQDLLPQKKQARLLKLLNISP